MKLIDIWDIDGNFWICNPQLKLAFKSVYDADKSKSKDSSSRIMWSVALFIDTKSKFRDLPELQREELIRKDYNKDFSVESCSEIISKWKSFLSPAERQLILWDKFMDEKNEYMSGLNYKENGDEIEKRLLTNMKLYDELARLRLAIAEEESEGIVKGGAVESLSEKGEI